MSAFRYTFYAQEVIFGPGSIAQLRETSERFGWHRIMLCTTAHARSRGHVTAVEDALGERLVASYEGVRPHVQDIQVAEALALAAEYQVDALIGLGGGSAIGMAKAASFELAEQQSNTARTTITTGRPPIPTVAIPTTYAGSEMTPVFGVTRQIDGAPRKVTVTDARVAPRLTIYDPLLTVDLPPHITASTGINAVAHCIEALYSITRNPLSSAAALAGLRAMGQALPRCYTVGDDLEARTEMLTGAFLAGTALANVAMGLHHGICHVLGGTAGVAHGEANSVMLPHVMRFNLDATAPQLAQAAGAMGIPLAGQSAEAAATEATQQVADWVRDMRLPQRLYDVGVREADLPVLAQLAFASRTVQNNPKAIGDVAQMEELLRQAW
ncbi:MAG TPA: iron-containing alcohol dehydrogenase [Ktedonobacterales bacterium]|nr:iron-containing alcohol dehydrogenase [Ktedonobacterales bacterium]